MHVVTFVFVLLEIALFFFQFIYYLFRPQEKNRFWYLVLLLLLILYNITGGLFPDKNIPIPIITQNILAYGSGFIMASYIPYYFYKAFNLERLRFHALYGIYFFLIIPFIIFFVIAYSIHGNLEMARKYGIVIPFFYTIVLLLSILRATRLKYQEHQTKNNLMEVVIVCCAVIPWASMPIMAYLNVSQVTEVTVCNGGFLIITAIFIKQSIDKSREEYSKLEELNTSLLEKVKERTRQLENLNEQRANNFVNLVHEIKTPITLIKNYLDEYLHKNGTSEELEIIKVGINKLARDITSLFDVERFNKGLTVYNHNQVSNFSQILKENLTLFENYCKKKEILYQNNINDGIYVKADPNAINRIVNNLIENAIKFTDSGGKIEISLKANEHKLCFTVMDTGIGITKHHLKKIFEPYYQISNATTSLQGMGLGLPIVKKVIESLAGRIIVKSNPEKAPGTKISVLLTCHLVRPVQETVKPTDFSLSAYSFENIEIHDTAFLPHRQTILLVEDNKAMLNYLFQRLHSRYNLFCASNGLEALKKLHEIPVIPDLILSDIMMDKMDGFAFAKAVSEQTAFSHIPIIFISAKSGSIDKLKGLRLGALDIIQKPFSSEELVQRIDSFLGNITKQRLAILQSTISNLKFSDSNKGKSEDSDSMTVLEQNCKLYNLSVREIEIVRLIRQGYKYKQIADQLFISERTVTKHVQNIFEKVKVSNKVELINKLDNSMS